MQTGGEPAERALVVREMQLDEVDFRIDYFHDSSDEHLRTLGVDRALLPTRAAWRQFYAEDYARPLRERESYSLIWELDGEVVGFSSVDRIHFGSEAFMHLHILNPAQRKEGLGAKFVRESAAIYFRVLELERLFCEPNAFNVAPNRTLQRVGFRYLFTHEAQPSPINPRQVTTRWVLDRPIEPDPGVAEPMIARTLV
jgi:RimJ/RimL family protein N-acetyltransferase